MQISDEPKLIQVRYVAERSVELVRIVRIYNNSSPDLLGLGMIPINRKVRGRCSHSKLQALYVPLLK
jgi:hypothetical protein